MSKHAMPHPEIESIRNNDGSLPSYAWPGGYPVVYLAMDCWELCGGCANGRNGSRGAEKDLDPETDREWVLSGFYIQYEAPGIFC